MGAERKNWLTNRGRSKEMSSGAGPMDCPDGEGHEDRAARAVCANTCRGVSAWLCLRNARGVVGMDPQDTLADAAVDKAGVTGWTELPYALR